MKGLAPGLLLTVLAASAISCGTEEGYLLRGSLSDADTGLPVSRDHVYLHFFCDEIGYQKTLAPDRGSRYEVRMPRRAVRVRVYDGSGVYRIFERRITIEGPERTFDIPLEPTHYVLLRGRVIEAATGTLVKPKPGIGSTPLFSFDAVDGSWSQGLVGPQADGTYSLRVPRTKIAIDVVDTPLAPKQPEIDLTGVTGPEHVFDLILEPPPNR